MRCRMAVALTVAALALTACSGDNADEPSVGPELVTSGDTGDTFLHGQVTDEGHPVEDARVVVRLWPERGDTKVGETVETFEVDAEMDDGLFVVALDPDDIPAKYRGDGYQNFEIQVWRGSQLATVSNATMTSVDGVWRTRDEEGDQLMRMDFDLGRDSLTITSSDGSVSERDLPGLAG